MVISAVIVLALAAGFLGALAEWLAGRVGAPGFVSRMAGLAVAALIVLAGQAGALVIHP